jgi:hypothetical protein
MAKDEHGHGSNSRNGGASGSSGHNTGWIKPDVADALRGGGGPGFGNTVTSGGHGGDWGNEAAAAQLASGPKSSPVPVHDSMSGGNMSAAHDYGLTVGTGPTMRPTNPAPDSTRGRAQISASQLAARRAASLERLP